MRFDEIRSKAAELARFDMEQRGRVRGWVAGVDEVGRGALAGPVVAAAVVLPKGKLIAGVYDSKALSPFQREELFCVIERSSLAMSWALIGPQRIDERNILRATHEAMREAVGKLERKPALVIVDGHPVPDFPWKQVAVVKGDSKSLSVAAASIVAKVVRDRLMIEQSDKFPHYNFSSNKGYASKEHVRAIEEFGPCEFHRMSFSPICDRGRKSSQQALLPLGV